MIRPTPALPDALSEEDQLAEGERFRFACHPRLPCFNQCCADVNIVLTPVDVLHLARGLGVSTEEFLETYTLAPITKDLKLPMVMLRMGEEPERKCSFVGEEGCTVYGDRPWACRMYPLWMGVPPARAGEAPEPAYFLVKDDFCKGREQPAEWDIDSWRTDQGVAEREELEAGFREIVSHPWFIGGRTLDPKRMEMFYTSCYDLDSFRRFVFESSFLERFDVEPEVAAEIAESDQALLRFAYRWLRFALFAEPTLRARQGPESVRREQ